MPNFYARALRSGSSGNLYLLEYGREYLVVDCGVSGRLFRDTLLEAGLPEEDYSRIRGILVTHEHRDHIAGLGVVMRRYRLPVYMTEKTWQAARSQLGPVREDLVHFVEAGQAFPLDDFAITPFPLSHDAADPVGYVMETSRGKVALCTDTGQVADEVLACLEGADLVFMEANYEPDLLELGPYPYPLKARIRSPRGHLSNASGATICRRLFEQGSSNFVLSHLSQNNNYPQLARLIAQKTLGEEGAQAGRDYQLEVASRYRLSPRIRVDR